MTSAALFKIQLMVFLLQNVFGNAVFQLSECVLCAASGLWTGGCSRALRSMGVFAEFFVRKEMFVNGNF